MRSQRQHRRGSIWDVHNQTFADLGRAFREAFGEQLVAPSGEAGAEWVPAVDLSETSESFVVRADLPGIRREAVDVTTEDDTLIIRGENPAPEAGDDDTMHRRERRHGRFRRVLTLPAAADPEQVSARLHDGVLEVTIAKARSAKPRRIEIST
ncbi:MAG: Hsp20/alpha crystallin family protein [Armatimonadota bacterium]